MNIILKKPIISEKSMKLAGSGLYTFLVNKDISKPLIAKAVAEHFKVTVVSVKTINMRGEIKMQRRVRKFYQTGSFKKALVQVKKGQTIPVFEMPKDEEAIVTTAESEPRIMKEKRNLISRTKVKVENTAVGAAQSTQRKVITGK
jgi:large subunit ribosomal protein L23